jgi:hypothetical protein
MDSLAQFAALCVNPRFEFTPGAPYRQIRAIWTLWRICQDLRAPNRSTIFVRAALPFATDFLVLLFLLSQFDIGAISLIFAILINIFVFLTMLYFVYWILAPSHIYEMKQQKIQEQSHCIALSKNNNAFQYKEPVYKLGQQPVDSEEQIRNIIRGLYAQSQQQDSIPK